MFVASDPLVERLGCSLEKIDSQWNWAPGSSFLNNSVLAHQVARSKGAFKAGRADIPDCPHCGRGVEETAWHAFYKCKRVRLFWSHVDEWTARILKLVDNVLPSSNSEKRVVFPTILAVTRMVIWITQKKGLYDGANFSDCGLILFFRHQLKVKIRCDWKRLDPITFNKRWVPAVSLVFRKGATLESSFLALFAHGYDVLNWPINFP